MAVGQLPAKLTQNTLDFWAKQIQEFIDAYYGSDNDNSNTPTFLPFSIDCYVTFNTQSLFYWEAGGYNGYLNGYVHLNIPTNNTDNYIREIIPDSHWDATNPIVSRYLDSYLNKNDAFIDDVLYMQRAGGTNTLFTRLDSDNLSQIFTYQTVYRNPNGDDSALVDVNKVVSISFDRAGGGFNWTKSGTGYNSLILKPLNNFPTVTGGGSSDYNSVINEVYNNSEYNNTYNYTTDNGDTVTTYYGDNYINYAYDGTQLSYDDIYEITNHVITDLTTNLGDGWNGDETPVYFPTYDEIKYVDMGDFYIEPIHQYGKLPTAPTFENTLDLASYPSAIGIVASKFIDFLPASISGLLAGAVIVSAIVSFIRRDA